MVGPRAASAIAVAVLLLTGALVVGAGAARPAPALRSGGAVLATAMGPTGAAPTVGPEAAVHPALDAGDVARTVFVNYNASIPGGFSSSVADWYLGPGAYVPSSGRLWLPNLIDPLRYPLPPSAPAVLFDPGTNSFAGLVPALANTSDLVYDPQNGLLYGTQPFSDRVVAIDPRTGSMAASPVPVGQYPFRLVLDTATQDLLVANFLSDNLTVVNTTTGTVQGSGVPLAGAPIGMVLDSASSTLFVVYENSTLLTVLNASTFSPLASSILAGFAGGIAFSPSQDTLGVTIHSRHYVTLINASSYATTFGIVPVGAAPGAIGVSTNGAMFLVGNASTSSLTVVNVTSGTVSNSTISVTPAPASFDSIGGSVYVWGAANHTLTAVWSPNGSESVDSPSLASLPVAATWDPFSQEVVVGSALGNSLSLTTATNLSGASLSTELPAPPISLVPVATTPLLVVGTTAGLDLLNVTNGIVVRSSGTPGGEDQALLFDPTTDLVWTLNSAAGLLAYDLPNLTLAFSVGVGAGLSGIQSLALDPATGQLFVPNNVSGSRTIAVVDATNGTVVNPAAASAPGLTSLAFDPADNTVCALGENITLLNASTGIPEPSVIPIAGHTVAGTIAYDAAREALYASSFESTGGVGVLTAVEGQSVSASYSGETSIPVGESPYTVAVVPGPGGASGSEIWTANEGSGTLSIVANSPPTIVGFGALPSAVDVGVPTTISVTIAGGAGPVHFSYSGLPTGCSPSDTASFACTPAGAGRFNVTVTATDSLGGVSTATTTVVVGAVLSVVGTFSLSTFPEIDVDHPFSMLGRGQGGVPPYRYLWTFGDGTNGSGAGLNHIYTSLGNFVLAVTVIDSVGATATASWAVTVVPLPTIQIVRSRTTTDVGLPVSFEALIAGGSGSNDSGFWNFDDGTTATGFDVMHAWSAPGLYNVSVTYVDGMGTSTNSTTALRVEPAPIGEFSVSGGSVQHPAAPGTPFYYNATMQYGTAPFTITWAFGDGTYGLGPAFVHSYTAPGVYVVNVTAVDSAGAEVNGTLTVTVGPAPGPGPTSGSIPGAAFDVGLFLGVVLGAATGVVLVFWAGSRRPPPPRPPPAAAPPGLAPGREEP